MLIYIKECDYAKEDTFSCNNIVEEYKLKEEKIEFAESFHGEFIFLFFLYI